MQLTIAVQKVTGQKGANSPQGSPQFPAGGQKLPFVQGHDPYGRLHDCDELLKLHLLTLYRRRHHAALTAAAPPSTPPPPTDVGGPPAHSTLPPPLVSFHQHHRFVLLMAAGHGEVPAAQRLRVPSPAAHYGRCPFGFFAERGRERGGNKQPRSIQAGGGAAQRGWQRVTLT